MKPGTGLTAPTIAARYKIFWHITDMADGWQEKS
jgi:hypothetical protein